MALRKSQTDKKLGLKINKLLEKEGYDDLNVNRKEFGTHNRIELLAGLFKNALELLLIDTKAEDYGDTHNNIARMWVNEIFWGLNYDNFPKLKLETEDADNKSPINTEAIPVETFDNEYFLPMYGSLSVSYVPKDKVISTESLYSLIEFFSRRPQEPRNFLNQIKETLIEVLGTNDVIVGTKLKKKALSIRGIEREGIYFKLYSASGTYKAELKNFGIIKI